MKNRNGRQRKKIFRHHPVMVKTNTNRTLKNKTSHEFISVGSANAFEETEGIINAHDEENEKAEKIYY